jgi:hypothetical protein
MASLRRTAVALALLLVTSAARADSDKVEIGDLPAAVTDTLKARFPGAKLVGADREKDGDKVTYEVELEYKGTDYSVKVSDKGKLLQIEKDIPFRAVPRVVVAAVFKKYPKCVVKEAGEISVDEKVTSYSLVIVTTDKKKLEVIFDTAGKFLEEDEVDDD